MWALYASLCIILVIAVYYKYKTRSAEGFFSPTDWFGQTVASRIEVGQVGNDTYYDTLKSDVKTGEEVFPIRTADFEKTITRADIPAILQLYGASLATVSQLRSAVGDGFSMCSYGYISDGTSSTPLQALGGKYQEYNWCAGLGLSANSAFDDGFVVTTPLEIDTSSSSIVLGSTKPLGVIYAYGVKPAKNEPPRSVTANNKTLSVTVSPWSEITANWWNRDSEPSNYEVYVVYPNDKVAIEFDYKYTAPSAIATAYNSTIATVAQARQEILGGIMKNTIYPHWTIKGMMARDMYISTAYIESETVLSGLGSSSSSGPGSMPGSASDSFIANTTRTPKLRLEKITQSDSSAPTVFNEQSKLTAPAVLLYGPKPAYDKREMTIGGRKYTAEFYNTVRNVWSKYDTAVYKCRDVPFIAVTNSMTYGEYARQYVHTLDTAVSGNETTVKITGAANANREYPGCNAACNACEKTEKPYYPVRPALEINKYKKWKNQPVKLPTKGDTTDVLEEQMYAVSETKRSMAIRLVDACRSAGGIVVLNSTERKSYDGCSQGSWCCAPDNDISINLPLSSLDPAADTLGKTCEPAAEQCDSSLGPAPLNTDAYSLSNRRRGSAVSQAVKGQFCKPKSGSVRTTVQERKSIKLLRRALAQ
jgi:hypothetical protein